MVYRNASSTQYKEIHEAQNQENPEGFPATAHEDARTREDTLW